MARCGDCIHYEVCNIKEWFDWDHDCEDFINKSHFVELPCKVGDTVYDKSGKEYEIEAFDIEKYSKNIIVSYECDYNCEHCACSSWHTDYSGECGCEGEYGSSSLPLEDFNRTLFLTREEAEKALAERRKS